MFFQNSNIHSTRLQPFSLHVYDGIVRLVNKKARVYLNFKRAKTRRNGKKHVIFAWRRKLCTSGFPRCVYIYYIYIYISSVTSIPYDFWDIPHGIPHRRCIPRPWDRHVWGLPSIPRRKHALTLKGTGWLGWMDGRTDGWMDIHRNMLCNDD